MLLDILVVVRPEKPAIAVGRIERQSIEFVVAHDGKSRAGVDHWSDDLKRLPDLWPSINEVTQKDRLPVRVTIDTVVSRVPELFQEPLKGVGVAVNVADEVVQMTTLHHGPNKAAQQTAQLLDTT